MVYIYVLRLAEGKRYVGKTSNPNFRLDDHFNGYGSAWTRKYEPISYRLFPDCDDFDEDKYTLKYMKKYGKDNVRGGSFCQMTLDKESIQTIERMIRGGEDKCYTCGEKGHFTNQCDSHQSNSLNEGEDELDEIKIKFIKQCKKFDKNKTGCISINNILTAFKKTDIDFKSFTKQDILDMLTKINICEEIYDSIYIDTSNHSKLIYEDFINGVIFIIDNELEFCSDCWALNKNCDRNCPSYEYKSRKKVSCFRCGRAGHYANSCYADWHKNGVKIHKKKQNTRRSNGIGRKRSKY
jgi:predicted GIY-YIG superfamily endonuclease